MMDTYIMTSDTMEAVPLVAAQTEAGNQVIKQNLQKVQDLPLEQETVYK